MAAVVVVASGAVVAGPDACVAAVVEDAAVVVVVEASIVSEVASTVSAPPHAARAIETAHARQATPRREGDVFTTVVFTPSCRSSGPWDLAEHGEGVAL